MAYENRANPLTQPLLEPGSTSDAAALGEAPVVPKSNGNPETGPAYDSITSTDSNFRRRDNSLSHVQPGQAIALPDGSVIPVVGEDTSRSDLPTCRDENSQPSYRPAQTPHPHTSARGGPTPGPFPGSYMQQQQPPLPSKIGATPGPAPGYTASPYVQSPASLPSKPSATPDPGAYPQQNLPSKLDATPGPAPGVVYPQGTPGPHGVPPHVKASEGAGPAPQYTGQQTPYQYPHATASDNRQPQYYPPSAYNYNQQQHYRYPPPPAPYQPQYQARGPVQQPLYPFPPTQYQPYRPPPPVQAVGQGAATPYYLYQQGTVKQQPKPRPPVKTSFKFDPKTLDDNHFYMAICLLVTVIVCVNPLGLLCTIPAVIFGYIAASANARDDYDEALKYHKKARFCNIGTGAAIITAGTYTIVIGIYAGLFAAGSS